MRTSLYISLDGRHGDGNTLFGFGMGCSGT